MNNDVAKGRFTGCLVISSFKHDDNNGYRSCSFKMSSKSGKRLKEREDVIKVVATGSNYDMMIPLPSNLYPNEVVFMNVRGDVRGGTYNTEFLERQQVKRSVPEPWGNKKVYTLTYKAMTFYDLCIVVYPPYDTNYWYTAEDPSETRKRLVVDKKYFLTLEEVSRQTVRMAKPNPTFTLGINEVPYKWSSDYENDYENFVELVVFRPSLSLLTERVEGGREGGVQRLYEVTLESYNVRGKRDNVYLLSFDKKMEKALRDNPNDNVTLLCKPSRFTDVDHDFPLSNYLNVYEVK